MSIVSTQAGDWNYLSEGGANIVFSYAGVPNPEFSGRVLKLRKSRRCTSADQNSVGHTKNNNHLVNECTSLRSDTYSSDVFLEFHHRVISRLINPQYLANSMAVPVNGTWLRALASLHEASRPEARRLTDGIDTTCTTAILTADLVSDEDFAIEIKVSS
jgi:inositol-pentakisphosphate 2-kinase